MPRIICSDIKSNNMVNQKDRAEHQEDRPHALGNVHEEASAL